MMPAGLTLPGLLAAADPGAFQSAALIMLCLYLCLLLALGALAMTQMDWKGASLTFLGGTAVVYAFLCYVHYLPTPSGIAQFLGRRRRLQRGAARRKDRARAL